MRDNLSYSVLFLGRGIKCVDVYTLQAGKTTKDINYKSPVEAGRLVIGKRRDEPRFNPARNRGLQHYSECISLGHA